MAVQYLLGYVDRTSVDELQIGDIFAENITLY